MSVDEIIHLGASGIGFLLVILLGFIKIPKKEINIWGIIGKEMTKDIDKKVTDLNKKLEDEESRFKAIEKKFDETNGKIAAVEQKLQAHTDEMIEDQMKVRRRAILQFDDEITEGRRKSKEHYINILDTIDHYEKYCDTHPDFPNNMCLFAIQHIKDEYQERLNRGYF